MREMERADLSDLDLSSSPPTPEWGETNGSTHVVQFYDDEAFPLDAIGRFVGPALGAGEACRRCASGDAGHCEAGRSCANDRRQG